MNRITDQIFGIGLLASINNILGEAKATGRGATDYTEIINSYEKAIMINRTCGGLVAREPFSVQ